MCKVKTNSVTKSCCRIEYIVYSINGWVRSYSEPLREHRTNTNNYKVLGTHFLVFFFSLLSIV